MEALKFVYRGLERPRVRKGKGSKPTAPHRNRKTEYRRKPKHVNHQAS